jgi:hypothetical protein
LNGKGMLIISKGGQKGWYWHIVGGQWYVVWEKNMDQQPPKREVERKIKLLHDSPLPNIGLYRQFILEADEVKK